jgi:hypothetical protein
MVPGLALRPLTLGCWGAMTWQLNGVFDADRIRSRRCFLWQMPSPRYADARDHSFEKGTKNFSIRSVRLFRGMKPRPNRSQVWIALSDLSRKWLPSPLWPRRKENFLSVFQKFATDHWPILIDALAS